MRSTAPARAWRAACRAARPTAARAAAGPRWRADAARGAPPRRRAVAASATEASPAAAPATQTHLGVAPPLVLYDTMTRSKRAFEPRAGAPSVGLYCCGVTVYDYSHIGTRKGVVGGRNARSRGNGPPRPPPPPVLSSPAGHARVYCSADVLLRYLRRAGHAVTYVRNFTDVDDKIIARAAEQGVDPAALAARFAAEFSADMASLACLPPTHEPRATAHVPDMVAMIERIVAAGHGYAAPSGDVLFAVDTLPGYGRLSRRSLDDNRAGERVAVSGDKRGAFDFVLWKSAKPGEPSWPSPWGPGRPGWHIECSAMARALLGPVVDIHAGGADLIHPHHDNEIAQSQAAACGCAADKAAMPGGVDFVRYWCHYGFVNVDAEKMSKSLGNFFTVRDAVARYGGAPLRLFLLSTHYRSPLNFMHGGVEAAAARLYYVYGTLADARAAISAAGDAAAAAAAEADVSTGAGVGGAALSAALAGLADDVNTPAALAALAAPLAAVNELLTTKAGKKLPDRIPLLANAAAGATAVLDALGLAPADPTAALDTLRSLALGRASLTEADAAAGIAERAAARASKDYAAADAVRVRFEGKGITFLDSPTGTTWRPIVVADDGA